ncbi:hypothetical protein [Vannielia litorea]|uniref:hypothetical protein n=1 Tax=Vannielia litorea TaxID=1217970 RepID=UPI001BCB0E5A|nr:hypothetical protein [Vannielia litorea]MBS8227319.1 hypothetical protein [Vannielia litorea]
MADHAACWPEAGIDLDRFTYDAFLGAGDVADADRRIKWLSQQYTPHLEEEFRPQPWVQCAKVLADTGHRADARAVLIEKEKRQRRARRVHHMTSGWWRLARPFYAIRDDLFYTSVGYGHATSKAFVWLLTFWGLGVAVFGMAEHAGAMKPNNAFILRAPEWVRCGVEAGQPLTLATGAEATGLPAPGQTQPACFLAQEEGKDYPRFNPYTYSLDTLVPLVSMEMQGFWVPDASSASLWGRASRWFLWLQIAVGWALSLLAVAGFSGLVRND